ncbi:MAG: type II secretion system inner membrane protein GspF [Gammaproteobacteria bacterium]|nr:type II secretion system inner membrane protein GspF [Gammaproteobacteria bacterium]
MPAYNYQALDNTGRELKGVMEGDSARQLRQQLRDKGWTPLEVAEVVQQKKSGKKFSIQLRNKISASELALATRQLATLVRSSLPLEEALHTVSRQSTRPNLKSIMFAVRSRVLEGHSLAQGLNDFPAAFPELYRATVAAGEQSGHLDTVLERLADYTEARQQLQQKISQALIYPILLTSISILVIVFLLTFVMPQITQVFANTGQQLPWLTTAMIATSEFLQDYGFLLLAGIVVAYIAARMSLKNESTRQRYHDVLLKIPLVKSLVQGLNTARFARTFSILMGSGVPVVEALRISAQVISNLPMRNAVTDVSHRVREGASLHKSLYDSGYFPPMTTQLIASGEASGDLDAMLERAAQSQEREVESLISRLMAIFEPVLLLVMGMIVLVIVLATLLPILELNQLIR